MGKINILKNGYRGKVGQTVGQQWNGQLTLRTHNEHNTSKTEAQLKQREAFKKVIEAAPMYYNNLFNYAPPKKFKGTRWNYIVKGLNGILNTQINIGTPFSIYPNDKKGLISGYGVYIGTQLWIISTNQSDRNGIDFSKTRFYGLSMQPNTTQAVAEAFENARPRFLKKNVPNAAAFGIHSNCVLYETPLTNSMRDVLMCGFILSKGSQKIYTEVIIPVGGMTVTEDQLLDWN